MKVLVTGAGGMLGSDTVDTLVGHGFDAIPVGRKEADITSKSQIFDLVSSSKPDFIVHCAAYTKVDDCEKNRELAFSVNAEGTRNIAGAATEGRIPLIYISTDYVFDGSSTRSYRENDPVNPINVYGESKLMGEKYVIESCEIYYILRTSWLFGKNGSNFVTTMRNMMLKGVTPIRVVNDQRGSPTWSLHLAGSLIQILKKSPPPASGIYHITGGGDCTWYDYSRKIADILQYGHDIIPIVTSEFPRDARRPAYSVLDNSLAEKTFGIKMPHWETAVSEFLSRLSMDKR